VEKLGIGFLGAGLVSELHAAGIAACRQAELVGLWNRTPARAAERARQFGCRTYDSPAELLADPRIEAVSVLTNLETHVELACRALAAGKHVLVEKPVGADLEELGRLQQQAAAAGRVCMPGHNYIYEAGLQRTRELLRQGRLGRLIAVYVMYHIHHPEEVAARYPGVIRQIMTHHAYILLYLAGRPTALSAMSATLHYQRLPQEDIALVNLRLEDGALAHFCASFAADDHTADPWTVLVKVIGTEGSARYSYRDWVELRPGAVHAQTYSAYPGSIANEIAHFVRCVHGDTTPLSSLADARDAQLLVEACERSAQQHQEAPVVYG
jgi:predicted dehydrogenase